MFRIQHQRAGLLIAAGLLGVAAASSASATELFVTSLEGQKIQKYDTATDTLTTVLNTPGQADSLIFQNSDNILYSIISTGQFARYTISTNTNTILAGGFNGPRDITLEPGGGSALLADFNNARLARIDLTTNLVTTLRSGINFDGVTYDNTGKLFAVANRNTILQLDTTTGATLNSINLSSLSGNLDGLTFDAFTGDLWVADFNGGIIRVPTTLASSTRTALSFNGEDGIEGDDAGNLFIASRGDSRIHKFNIPGTTEVAFGVIPGLDDLAPVAGLGSIIGVPEPSTLILSVVGLSGLLWARRRRLA